MAKKKSTIKKEEEKKNKKPITLRMHEAEIDYLDGLAELVEAHTGVPTNRTWVLSRCIVLGGKLIEEEFSKKSK